MFDLSISNPPFKVATCITLSQLKTTTTLSVVLMPFMKFKAKELYKYALESQKANHKEFLDKHNDIKPDLMICKLSSRKDFFKELIDIEKPLWETNLRKYYEANLKKRPTFYQKDYFEEPHRTFVEKHLERILFIPYWQAVGNAQSDRSVTKKANAGNPESLNKILSSNRCYAFWVFQSKEERDNAYKFWCSDICNKLIQGNPTRLMFEKFPHVDWHKTWTFEKVLEYLNVPSC